MKASLLGIVLLSTLMSPLRAVEQEIIEHCFVDFFNTHQLIVLAQYSHAPTQLTWEHRAVIEAALEELYPEWKRSKNPIQDIFLRASTLHRETFGHFVSRFDEKRQHFSPTLRLILVGLFDQYNTHLNRLSKQNVETWNKKEVTRTISESSESESHFVTIPVSKRWMSLPSEDFRYLKMREHHEFELTKLKIFRFKGVKYWQIIDSNEKSNDRTRLLLTQSIGPEKNWIGFYPLAKLCSLFFNR